jgi:hypothetical protein
MICAKEVNAMKRVLLALALLGMVAGAGADPNDLSGGVLITHAPANFIYSPGMNWCAEYATQYGITSCDEQVTNMPVTGSALESTLFYVVAAWGEAKTWCGTEFGISPEFDGLFYFGEYGPCLVNNLENSTGGWPGAGEGTAVVATDTPWDGDFVATYYFVGYTYYTTRVALDVDPAQNFAGTGNCDVPAVVWDAVCLGAVGTGDDPGMFCCPNPPVPEACCIDYVCYMLTEYECGVAGGDFYAGMDCATFECPQPEPEGACCLETGECFFLIETDCVAIGGAWQGEGTNCDPNLCPQPPVVCCVGVDCYFVPEDECLAMQGDVHPEYDSCDPNPCGTPADDSSWGSIKALYR